MTGWFDSNKGLNGFHTIRFQTVKCYYLKNLHNVFLVISSTISTLKFWFSLANGSRHRKVKKEDVKIDIKCSWNFKFNVNHFISLRRTDTQKRSVSPQTLIHKCEIILIHIKHRHLEPGQYSVYFLDSITGNWQFLYLHYKACIHAMDTSG